MWEGNNNKTNNKTNTATANDNNNKMGDRNARNNDNNYSTNNTLRILINKTIIIMARMWTRERATSNATRSLDQGRIIIVLKASSFAPPGPIDWSIDTQVEQCLILTDTKRRTQCKMPEYRAKCWRRKRQNGREANYCSNRLKMIYIIIRVLFVEFIVWENIVCKNQSRCRSNRLFSLWFYFIEK